MLRICLSKNTLNLTEKVQISLISDFRNGFSDVGLQFLLFCLPIQTERFGEQQCAFDYNVLETSVNAWLWVAKEAKKNGNPLYRQIKSSLCAMLAFSLKNQSAKAAALLVLFEKCPESLDLCMDFSLEDISWVLIETDFLNSLLKTDSHRLLKPILFHLSDMDVRLSNVWEAGYLDASIELLVRQIKSSPKKLDLLLEVVVPKTFQRLIQALRKMEKPKLDGIIPLLDLVCKIFDLGNIITFDIGPMVTEVIRILSLLRKTQFQLEKESHSKT